MTPFIHSHLTVHPPSTHMAHISFPQGRPAYQSAYLLTRSHSPWCFAKGISLALSQGRASPGEADCGRPSTVPFVADKEEGPDDQKHKKCSCHDAKVDYRSL